MGLDQRNQDQFYRLYQETACWISLGVKVTVDMTRRELDVVDGIANNSLHYFTKEIKKFTMNSYIIAFKLPALVYVIIKLAVFIFDKKFMDLNTKFYKI